MRTSLRPTSISSAAWSSCSTREKYSGVRFRREAMVALLTGNGTVIGSGCAAPSWSRSR